MGGSLYVAGTYYDNTNTSYYVKPSGTTHLSALTLGNQVASRNSYLDIEGIDPQITLHNTNDTTVGGFIQNTYECLTMGMYNPTGSTSGVIPANTQRTMFGMTYNGLVGTVTSTGSNVSAYNPSFRNVIDDNSGNMSATGNITAYSSDKRLKTNIRKIDNAIEKVNSLSGFLYNWNDLANELAGYKTDIDEVGVIAQDVQNILPEAVKPAPFDYDIANNCSRSGENYLTVQYDRLVPLLIEAIKEQQDQIKALNTKVELLEEKLNNG
jgi:hypothetical protein